MYHSEACRLERRPQKPEPKHLLVVLKHMPTPKRMQTPATPPAIYLSRVRALPTLFARVAAFPGVSGRPRVMFLKLVDRKSVV